MSARTSSSCSVDIIQQILRSAAADVVDGIGRKGKSVLAGEPFRSALHDADYTLYDVINICKVPLAVSIVENLYRFSGCQLLRGGEIEHIRTAGGAIDGEKPQACRRNVIKLGVTVRQQFVALLGGGIEGDGIVHLVVHREGHFFISAIYGRTGGVYQMLHRIVAAGFQNVVKADQVAFDIHIRMVDGIANACLSS